MTGSLDSDRAATPGMPPTQPLRRRLAELRGADKAPRPLDARALAALAANPGCRRRALLDGAGVDKAALADALGAPAVFGQSGFAFARGHAFEARVKADGGAELIRLVHERVGGAPAPDPEKIQAPDLSADGPAGRTARTRLALEEATARGGWTLLDHPTLELEVAGSPVHLEPDAVAVHPDGSWTVVEIKSFPILDGAADPAKVGAATRQAAVYALALERLAEDLARAAETAEPPHAQPGGRPEPEHGLVPGPGPGGESLRVRTVAVLICPKDFSNLPTAEAVDIRKQLATTRRQLARLARVEEIAAMLPSGITFDPARPAGELTRAVESVPATYAPDCLAVCELAFHCRDRARAAGSVAALGRSVRGELGGLTTVSSVLAAAYGTTAPAADHMGDGAGPRIVASDDPGITDDPAVTALRRAARLRAEALGTAAC